jgi:hypothetical protein
MPDEHPIVEQNDKPYMVAKISENGEVTYHDKPVCPNGCDPKYVMWDDRPDYKRWFCKSCGESIPPIVERPDWFFDLPFPGGSRMPQVKRYIEYLEMELKLCKASKGPFKKITALDVQREMDHIDMR